jgi:hypothetical protein
VVLDRLDRIESILSMLVERETVKDYYDIEEFAKIVGKAAFTCREWCRHGRILGEKRLSGRGAYPAWVVPHHEVIRYQREGLRPIKKG